MKNGETSVLVAEDDPVSARILGNFLDHLGYEMVLAKNGELAWDLYRERTFRLVISDWMMPERDGLELCQAVRGQGDLSYTYFILLTANHTSPENYALAAAAGVDDFLTKPLDRLALRMRLAVAERILGFTAEIRQLRGMIPVCVYCRKVRDEDQYWDQVEGYLARQTGRNVTHCACPSCFERELQALEEPVGAEKSP